jgi:uncharacterized membrane protein YoaK (UPF0700 family)
MSNDSPRGAQRSSRWRPQRTRDLLLSILSVAAGSVDALSWLALGKVFSAFMTGNVVFIAVGLSSHDSAMALHAAIAVGAFGAGAWATAAAMPRQRPGTLWPAGVTVGLLGCALVQLAFWVVWLAVDGHPASTVLLLLAISAFAMGVQTATAVALGVHAVFTTAATATWTVLVGDTAHWSMTRIERRRLVLVLGGMLLGAVAGALLLVHLRLWMPALPALLTGGVAAVAHRSVEEHPDPTRTSLSAAPHPRKRAFGRSPGGPEVVSRGH